MDRRLIKEGRSFLISLQESWQYIKAILTGQVQISLSRVLTVDHPLSVYFCIYFITLAHGQMKKARAKTEQEASEADLQTAKAQVEATDAAEEKKRQLGM